MASPFQQTYDGRVLLPAPNSQDGPKPVSFKTNVNRMKTKRWVEAKKISYDGDDWGDDEYGEYDHDDDEEVRSPPVPSHLSAGTSSSLPAVPQRPHGFDRSMTMDAIGSVQRPSPAARSQTSDGRLIDSSHVPFVRPADIYKRMLEEKQKQQTSEATELSLEPPHLRTSDPVADIHVPSNLYNTVEPVSAEQLTSPFEQKDHAAYGDSETKPLPTASETLTSSPQHQEDILGDPQETSLEHNPSLGFRSVVHQAFDVPETPSTTVETLGRSDSDSTIGVSPIISRGGPDEAKTPTIMEELGETVSTPGNGTDQNFAFKPGHRRDLSLPGSENSASRKPKIHCGDSDTIPQSALAELSSVSPSEPLKHDLQHPEIESLRDVPQEAPLQPRSGSPKHDFPPPLRLSNIPTPDTGQLSAGNLPTIVSMASTETSPQATDNDRLREEIILSLSRENSPARDSEQQYNESQLRTADGNTLSPGDYSRYSTSHPEPSPGTLEEQVLASGEDVHSPIEVEKEVSQPKLKRRFSWESSSSEDLAAPNQEYSLYQTSSADLQAHEIAPTDSGFDTDSAVRDATVIPPLSQNPDGNDHNVEGEEPASPLSMEDNVAHTSLPLHPVLPEPVENAPALEIPSEESKDQQTQLPSLPPPAATDLPLLGFRDILGIKSSQERIRAFDRTRHQFASINTGLDEWVEAIILTHPEYSDIMEQNQQFASAHQKQFSSKTKFPKLTSLGNLASHLDNSLPGSGSHKRSSGQLGSQRGSQRSKEFLHTAGLLGGKAGGAAKELFAKGRSKLRNAGTDKVYKRAIGRRRSLPHPGFFSSSVEDADVLYHKNPLLRTSIDLATLPKVKFPGNTEDCSGSGSDEAPNVEMALDNAEHREINVTGGLESPVNEIGERIILSQDTAELQMQDMQTENLEPKDRAVGTTRQESSFLSTALSSQEENSSRANPDVSLDFSFEFERELIAALRLDDTNLLSQGLVAPGIFSGENNYRLSLTDFSHLNPSSASGTGTSTRSSLVSTQSLHDIPPDADNVPSLASKSDYGFPEDAGKRDLDEDRQLEVKSTASRQSSGSDLSETVKTSPEDNNEDDQVPYGRSSDADLRMPEQPQNFPLPQPAESDDPLATHEGDHETHDAVMKRVRFQIAKNPDESDSLSERSDFEDSVNLEDPEELEHPGSPNGLWGFEFCKDIEDQKRHANIQKSVDLQESGELNGDVKKREDSENAKGLDDSVSPEGALPEREDNLENQEVLGEHNTLEKQISPEHSKAACPEDKEGLESNNDLHSNVSSENEDDACVDFKFAQVTVMKPIEDRVNLLINGQPVGTFHTGKDNPGPCQPVSDRGYGEEISEKSAVTEASKRQSNIAHHADSQQNAAEPNTTNDIADNSTETSSSATAQSIENLQEGGRDFSDQSTPIQAEKPESTLPLDMDSHDVSSSSMDVSPVCSQDTTRSNVGQDATHHPNDSLSLKSEEKTDESSDAFKRPSATVPDYAKRHRPTESITTVKPPRSRFYRSLVQLKNEQDIRQRSSFSSTVRSRVSSVSVVPQNEHLQRGQAVAERMSSDLDKLGTQITPRDGKQHQQNRSSDSPALEGSSIKPKQVPGPTIPRHTQHTLLPGTHSRSGSAQSNSEKPAALVPDSKQHSLLASPVEGKPLYPPQTSQSQSPMSRWQKLKIGVPHRPSSGLTGPDGPQKGTRNKLSGFFRRSGGTRDTGKVPVRSVEPPVTQSSSQSPPMSGSPIPHPDTSPISHIWYSPDDMFNPYRHKGTSSLGTNSSFRGTPPPPGGYYAPSSASPSLVSQKLFEDRYHQQQQQQYTYSPPQQFTYQQSATSTSPIPSLHQTQSPVIPPSPLPSLHGRTSSIVSDEFHTPRASISSSTAPGITATAPSVRSMKIGARPNSVPNTILRGEARHINASAEPVELPISADDSSEEILMTSTAYPGQEWRPAGFGGIEQF